MQQMNLFEATYEKPSFPSHIKLIELFAGIGAQFKSLKALGVDVESHRTCEWSWQSIIAYNAIHHRRIDEPPIYNYVNEDELLAENELKQHTISKIEQEINDLQKRLKEVRDGE